MNPNHIKIEKKFQSENSNSIKNGSGRSGRPETNYLTRCHPFSDQLVTSDINSAQEGFEYLYTSYRKAILPKTEKFSLNIFFLEYFP